MISKVYLKILPLTAALVLTIAFNACVTGAKPKAGSDDREQFKKVFAVINRNKVDSEALLQAVKAKNTNEINRILRKNGYDGDPVGAPPSSNCICKLSPSGLMCSCHNNGVWQTE